MRRISRRLLPAVMGLSAAIGLAGSALAQAYPTKPVTFVIGFAPGGPSDVLSRILCKKFEELLGQAFVIENKAGAGGGIAAAHVARQSNDGYTLMLGARSVLAGNQFVYKQINYDPEKDFDLVTIVGAQPNILYVHPSLPVNNLKEFIAYAKDNPGKLSFGSGGVGTASHFAGEQLNRDAGIQIKHVPHRGTGQVIQAVLGNHIAVGLNPPTPLVPLIQGNQIRAIASTALKRSAALPDVPTFHESGFPNFEHIDWHSVAGPRGLPKHVVDVMLKATLDALKDENVRKQLTGLGVDVWGTTPEEARKILLAEIPKQENAARLAGVKREQE
jgi:tripartite-type tricarboxylate transporter receptor subunit TctC